MCFFEVAAAAGQKWTRLEVEVVVVVRSGGRGGQRTLTRILVYSLGRTSGSIQRKASLNIPCTYPPEETSTNRNVMSSRHMSANGTTTVTRLTQA